MNRVIDLVKDNKITVIGITGGVGCGKSTIVDYIKEQYNATVFKADDIGHIVMQRGNLAYDKIVQYFGEDILDIDLQIDRKTLSNLVFNNTEKLEYLNSIIHPAVEQYIANNIILEYKKSKKLFVIEAALLIEAGYKRVCNELWYIYVDREERIKRLMASRGYSRSKCIDIMDNQLSDAEFKANCNVLIDNGNDFKYSKIQIEKHMNFCYN